MRQLAVSQFSIYFSRLLCQINSKNRNSWCGAVSHPHMLFASHFACIISQYTHILSHIEYQGLTVGYCFSQLSFYIDLKFKAKPNNSLFKWISFHSVYFYQMKFMSLKETNKKISTFCVCVWVNVRVRIFVNFHRFLSHRFFSRQNSLLFSTWYIFRSFFS